MKFRFEHCFPFGFEECLEVFLDAEVLPQLVHDIPSIESIEVCEWRRRNDRIFRRIRYQLHPFIEKIGPKTVRPEWLSWVEETEFDLRKAAGTFQNTPTHARMSKRLTNSGIIAFRAQAKECVRTMSGDLRVSFPVLGRLAERIIAHKAERLLEEEAEALNTYLVHRSA